MTTTMPLALKLPAEDHIALAALVDECISLRIPRQVLLLELPGTLPRPLRPNLRRLLADQLEPFALADRARHFGLPDSHVALVWRAHRDDALEQSAERLRVLLSDATDATDCVTLCHLPADGEQIQAFLRRVTAPRDNARKAAPARKLNVAELAGIEQALSSADVARFVRRSRVWQFGHGGLLPRWDHRRLDLIELAAALAPGFDLAADPWLYRRLARTLDRRMLALLGDPTEVRGAGPFIIDLDIDTILHPAFLRFDASLPLALRGEVMLRLSPADLVQDPAGFLRARELARARAYRLLLGGGDPRLAALFPPARSRIEMVEVAWPLAEPPLPGRHLLLTGANNLEALEWAVQHDVALVSGSAADAAGRPPGRH
jgi:hypothetical protein